MYIDRLWLKLHIYIKLTFIRIFELYFLLCCTLYTLKYMHRFVVKK